MKTNFKAPIVFLCVLLFIVSCVKDETTIDQNQNKNEEFIYAEQAFPGITGEIVTVKLNGEDLTCELINGLYVHQGDILLNPGSGKGTKGAGIDLSIKKWPYGIVYYKVNANLPNKQRITDAIAHWEDKTDIVFIERTDEKNYVEFVQNSTGCSSMLGIVGGKQLIDIADWGKTGNVIHEIGHAVGLLHEQSKNNRDSYVIILWDNIIPKKENNFKKYPKNFILETENFDFESLMLYNSWGFSKQPKSPNPLATMTKLDGSTFIAQRNKLSEMDIEMISKMYNDLHDPIKELNFGDSPGNVHITSDGTYFYTICDGTYDVGRINKLNLTGIRVKSYFLPVLKGRGLSYNKADGLLYASIDGGHIIRIKDLEKGIFDTIYRGIMQNKNASFALSGDGKKMYDFYKGTVRVYDFVTGKILNTITGLSYGSGDTWRGAEAAIAVDYSYLYTWDPVKRIVYVYNHLGALQRTLTIPDWSTKNGWSLSVFNGYLFHAGNQAYGSSGYWTGYNIRNPIKE